MNVKTAILSLLALCLTSSTAMAQGDVEYKMEIGGGVGLATYFGDFNSSLLKNQQPMASVMLRRVINPYMALRADVAYGSLKGEYDASETFYPTVGEENSKFKNSLFDISATYEYNFWPYGTGKEYRHAKRIVPFIFLGIGATIVDTGNKTEFTGNLPLGLGVKYKAGDRLNVGLEWGMHFSLSDNLDGVVDPYKIKRSVAFKNTDCYSMLQLTLTYSIMPKCSTCNPDR